MKILLIGSGGRESALAWKIASSEMVSEIIVTPGNPGMKIISPKISLLGNTSWEDLLKLKPDMVIVGPEAPLMEGIVDFFELNGVKIVGPRKSAAALEGSKIFCKEILGQAHIPTADYGVAKNEEEAEAFLQRWNRDGVVVKVDGLAQGKGVVVASTKEEGLDAARKFFSGEYLGYKADRILLEEKLEGEEVSCFALCDGTDFVFLGSATDYKRLLDGDKGPNTGGMGTVSPSPIFTTSDEEWVARNVFAPTLKLMKNLGRPFKGFLFAGLMKTQKGIYVLEFNTRLGDPETQSLIPRIQDDFVPFLMASTNEKLRSFERPRLNGAAVHVVMAANGYPGVNGQEIQRGDEISLLPLASDAIFFPAGISEKEGKLVSHGGRVCGVTALGNDLSSARSKAYSEIRKIHFSGACFREDIGAKFL